MLFFTFASWLALVVLDSMPEFYARAADAASPEWLANRRNAILEPDAERN
jgi:hypothetical protein